MKSFWSRLGLSRLTKPDNQEQPRQDLEPQAPPAEPAESESDGGAGKPLLDISAIKLGIDFGTTSTQVAVRVGDRAPRLLRLDAGNMSMPSFFAIDENGIQHFGSAASNMPSVHSVKLLLTDNAPITALDGMLPSEVAFLMIRETVRRTIAQLVAERTLPRIVDRLDVATNLGCTPAFSLEQRLRLRDAAVRAGLTVQLVHLVEEPVAAAFELILNDIVPEGNLMVIDVGGGTLDVAVVKATAGENLFELYATSGREIGGDRFTRIVVDRLKAEVASIRRLSTESVQFTRADESRLWTLAESAKIDLSSLASVRVGLAGLGGIEAGEVELDATWLRQASGLLCAEIQHHVLNVYRMARLVLDRGGPRDRYPGSVNVEVSPNGQISKRITDLHLNDDGRHHLDAVVLVGGASRMPAIRAMFEQIFGPKLFDLETVGLDPTHVVALGLGRHQALELSSLRYPNWSVVAAFDGTTGETERELYEPYAPAFTLIGGNTSCYTKMVAVPEGAIDVTLIFRQVGKPEGHRWEPSARLAGASKLQFEVNLFGEITFGAPGRPPMFPGQTAPWRPTEQSRLEWFPADWADTRRNYLTWNPDTHLGDPG